MTDKEKIRKVLSEFEKDKQLLPAAFSIYALRKIGEELYRDLGSLQDYRVVCDESNNSPENIDQHLLTVDIYINDLALSVKQEQEEKQ